QIIARQRNFNRCLDKAKLLPDIIAAAVNFKGKYTLNFIQFLDGVSQLDFSAGAKFLLSQKIKYLRCQNIPADNRHVGWRGSLLWFLDKGFHLMQIAGLFLWIDNPVTMCLIFRYFMYTDDRCFRFFV